MRRKRRMLYLGLSCLPSSSVPPAIANGRLQEAQRTCLQAGHSKTVFWPTSISSAAWGLHPRAPRPGSIPGHSPRARASFPFRYEPKKKKKRRQFSGNFDSLVNDKEELQNLHKLEKLYVSTRSAKNFQREIVRGVEGHIGIGSKKDEIYHKLAEDCMKFGADNTCTRSNTLSKAALSYTRARALIKKEHRNLLKALNSQVAQPLRAMVTGAPLEDARQLAKCYDKMRQEVEAQLVEVSKRQQKARESPDNVDNNSKLETAESKLQELKAKMVALGNEAVAAMTDVGSQQQKFTVQLLISLIEAERAYHRKIVTLLEQLEGEIASEHRRMEVSPSLTRENYMPPVPSYEEATGMCGSENDGLTELMEYFLAEAMLSYQAETDVEINLSAGDYVVVRKVSSNGWAEGECKGKAGWFPFEYIERRERVLASKIAGAC